MQVQRYLLNNRFEIVSSEQGIVTEYRPVYKRSIQVYKGIENTIQFRLLNQDQKPINTSLYTPHIVVFDENNNQLFDRVCTVLDDGSSATKGLFEVVIQESDTLNLKQQYLSFSTYLVDSNDNRVITYSDQAFNNKGTIYLSSSAFPGPKEPHRLTIGDGLWRKDTSEDIWYSDAINAQPAINGNEALHSVAVYSSNFAGTINVEASLTPQLSDDSANADNAEWTVVSSIVLDNETSPVVKSFNGVYDYLRMKTTSDPTTSVTKIIIRN